MPGRGARPVGGLLLGALVLLAGCLGATEPLADGTAEPKELPRETPRAAPDGRGEFAAFRETNRTESGVGGVDHSHDYWLGRDRVVLDERDLTVTATPLFADGGQRIASSQVFRPPPPALVYEGTATVEVLLQEPNQRGAPYPFATLELRYLTAKDGPNDWRSAGTVTYGTPVLLQVRPDETDMPHSVASLWAFKVVSDGPHSFSVNVTITAVRGAGVLQWPGHPDLYAERTSRVVFQGDAVTRKMGLADILVYGDDTNWNHPERLISWGTTRVDVFANITRFETPGGVQPSGYFLEFHNASTTAYTRISDADGENDLSSYRFTIEVDDNGMDSPYAPSSRWGFRILATYANAAGLGLCPGCFPYTIDYHLTVVAVGARE